MKILLMNRNLMAYISINKIAEIFLPFNVGMIDH